MTGPRFRYEAATDELIGAGPVCSVRVRLEDAEPIADRWRRRGYVNAANGLMAAAAEVTP